MSFDRQGVADHAAQLANNIQGNLKRSLEALGVVGSRLWLTHQFISYYRLPTFAWPSCLHSDDQPITKYSVCLPTYLFSVWCCRTSLLVRPSLLTTTPSSTVCLVVWMWEVRSRPRTSSSPQAVCLLCHQVRSRTWQQYECSNFIRVSCSRWCLLTAISWVECPYSCAGKQSNVITKPGQHYWQ